MSNFIVFKPKHELEAEKNLRAFLVHVASEPSYQAVVRIAPRTNLIVSILLPFKQGNKVSAALSCGLNGDSDRVGREDLVAFIRAFYIEASIRRFYIAGEKDAKNWRVNHVLIAIAQNLQTNNQSIHDLSPKLVQQIWKKYYEDSTGEKVNRQYFLALKEIIELLTEFRLLYKPFALPELAVRQIPSSRNKRQSVKERLRELPSPESGRALMELGGRMLASPEDSGLLERYTHQYGQGEAQITAKRLQQAYGPLLMVPLLNALGVASRTDEICNTQVDSFNESEENIGGRTTRVLAFHKFASKSKISESVPLDSQMHPHFLRIQEKLLEWSAPARALSAFLDDQGVTKKEGYPADQPVYLPKDWEWIRGVGATRTDLGKLLGTAITGPSKVQKFSEISSGIDPSHYLSARREMVKSNALARLLLRDEISTPELLNAEMVEVAKDLSILSSDCSEKQRRSFLENGHIGNLGRLKVMSWDAVESFLKSEIVANLPNHFPELDPGPKFKFRDSLFIGLGNQYLPAYSIQPCWVSNLSQNFRASYYGSKKGGYKAQLGIFEVFGYFEENEKGEKIPCRYDVHAGRHQSHTHLLLVGVDLAIINRIHGRDGGFQGDYYDHTSKTQAIAFSEKRELTSIEQKTQAVVWKQTAVNKLKQVYETPVHTKNNILIVQDKEGVLNLFGQHEVGGFANGFRVCSKWDLAGCEHFHDCFMCESLTCYSLGDETDLEKIAKLELDIQKLQVQLDTLEKFRIEKEIELDQSIPPSPQARAIEQGIERRRVLQAFYNAKKPRPLMLTSWENPSAIARKAADLLIDFTALHGASVQQMEIEIQKLIEQ